MSSRGVAIIFSLAIAVCGCGGENPTETNPTVTTMSEADINAMCVGFYDAVDTFDNLPKPLTQDQLDRLAALNERIDTEC
jgi:hypothetical protein